MQLPDVTSNANHDFPDHLKWVGMEKVSIPFKLETGGHTLSVNALADIFVSLDSEAKGIHMSRLYRLLNDALSGKILTDVLLKQLLNDMIESQSGLSNKAKLSFQFELPLRKKALLSEHYGYTQYPIVIDIESSDDKAVMNIQLDIPYSSTCPCSAALSRQLLSQAVEQKFADHSVINKGELAEFLGGIEGSIATPHSQRSYAYLTLTLSEAKLPDFANWIGLFEESIGTPVQTAVKREDEQAFAALNAQNLMFCEDAARRLKSTLESISQVTNYQFKVEHQESLHAHNAVVRDSKF